MNERRVTADLSARAGQAALTTILETERAQHAYATESSPPRARPEGPPAGMGTNLRRRRPRVRRAPPTRTHTQNQTLICGA